MLPQALGLALVIAAQGVAEAQNTPCPCEDWRDRHPEWIWCDDFEDPSPLSTRYFEYDNDDGDFIPMDGIGMDVQAIIVPAHGEPIAAQPLSRPVSSRSSPARKRSISAG